MSQQRVRAAGVPAGLIGLLLSVTGCTGLLQPETPTSTPPARTTSTTRPPDPSSTASPGPTEPAGPATPTASSGGNDLGDVVAIRTITVTTTVFDDDKNPSYADPATIRIYPLRRQGSVTQLNFSISLDPKAHADWDSGQELSTKGFADASIDDVSLIDPKHAQVYYTGYDKVNDSCLCSGRMDIEPGGTVLATAAFAAPPADVETVTVTIPLFGSFDRVPIA